MDTEKSQQLITNIQKGSIEKVISILTDTTSLNNLDVNQIISQDKNKTALWIASSKGYVKVVELLLGYPSIHANQTNTENETPLYTAAMNGHEKVVELLLKHKDVDPKVAKLGAENPMLVAKRYGHKHIFSLICMN